MGLHAELIPAHQSFGLRSEEQFIGADSGFDRIDDAGGARRGAVGLVKSRKKIVANDENYALAA